MNEMFSAGSAISHYRVVDKIGAGGMGEVYLAEDTSLGRKIALKILPADVASNVDRMRRFTQEARSAAALNHPNIAHIYEIGEADGVHFIAMEYVAGNSLDEKIGNGPLPVADIVQIGLQIADALDEAHSNGIIHRDIKSANIMLDHRGRVKVLDFGLAKISQEMGSEAPTAVKTQSGIVMGTASYMSPEQALGRETDARTDIWSLGVILYEMATGRLPFRGESLTDTIDKITHSQPEAIARFNYDVPPELEVIIKKALRKAADERYQSVHDLLIDLKMLAREMDLIDHSSAPSLQNKSSAEIASTPQTGEQDTRTLIQHRTTEEDAAVHTTSSAEYVIGEIKRHKAGVIAAAAVVLIAAAAGSFGIYRLLTSRSGAASPRDLKFVRLTTGGVIGNENIVGGANISPDGKRVVFWTETPDGKSSCWVRQISSNSTVKILGPVEGGGNGSTFSPDGEFIYFNASSSDGQQSLFQVSVIGGTPRRILEGVSSPISFSPDGKQFAFVRGDPSKGETSLMVANAEGGGTPRTLVTRKLPEYFSTDGPGWSPDGKVVACGAGSAIGGSSDSTVVEVSANGGGERPITSARWNSVGRIAWLSDGAGLITDGYANPLSAGTQIWYISYPGGEAHRITNDLNGYGTISLGISADASTIATVQEDFSGPIYSIAPNEDPSRARQISTGKYDGMACLAVAADGKIVFCDHTGDADDVWIMNADGTERKVLTDDQFQKSNPAVSPDGRKIVFSSNRSGNVNLWLMDIDGNNLKQVTEGTAIDDHPAFSPDGKWIVFDSLRSGTQTIWRVSAAGGTPEQLTDAVTANPSVSPDGRLIACFYFDAQSASRNGLGILPFDGGPFIKSFELPATAAQQPGLKWTLDGQGLTYVTGTYASNMVNQPIAGGPWKPLTSFKTNERIFNFAWSRDGKQLIYARGPFVDDVVLIKDFR